MIWLAVIVGIVLLLIKFPKQTLWVGGIAIVVVVGFFWFVISDSERRTKEYQIEKDAVVVTVKFDTAACSSEFPLHIIVTNTALKTVYRVDWDFAAYRPGYSGDLIDFSDYSSHYHVSTDKILAPGESFSICYRAPKTEAGSRAEQLEWTIAQKSVDFGH